MQADDALQVASACSHISFGIEKKFNRITSAINLALEARPHLAIPAWTLTKATKIGYTPLPWPKQCT